MDSNELGEKIPDLTSITAESLSDHVMGRNVDRVVYLVTEGIKDVNEIDTNGHNPLFCAVESNQYFIARFLIEKGADVNLKYKHEYFTILIASVFSRNVQLTSLLLDHGANIDDTDLCGETPLMWAVKEGMVDMATLLINRGANLEKLEPGSFMTALLLSIQHRQPDTALLLIDSGADVNIKNIAGTTPIIWAASNGYYDVVERLIDAGANMDFRQDSFGNTALMRAIEHDYTHVSQLLIERGADLHIQNFQGATALIWAAGRGYIGLIRLLIEKGSDLDAEDDTKCTPLMCAVGRGFVNIVDVLIKAGANINIRNTENCTALTYAVQSNNGEIVDLLVNNVLSCLHDDIDYGNRREHIHEFYNIHDVQTMLLRIRKWNLVDDLKYKTVATKLSEIHNYVYRCNIYKILNRGKFLKADIINDVVSFLGYRHC